MTDTRLSPGSERAALGCLGNDAPCQHFRGTGNPCLECVDAASRYDAARCSPDVAATPPHISEEERHAIGHARYQVEQAKASLVNSDCCFDYQLVADLLRVIDRASGPAQATPEGVVYRRMYENAIREIAALRTAPLGQSALATLLREYASDLRRNSGGSDDYPLEWAKVTADYLEILIDRASALPSQEHK